MGIPATTGQSRTNVQDMEIGDYISCKFYSGTPKILFANIGTYVGTEVPLSGISGTATGQGLFYFIKVDKGLLIADRVLLHSISWDELNSLFYIQGKHSSAIHINFTPGVDGIIRSITGGVAYADANGNKSTTDLGFGAWPTNNEWDKYIVKSDLEGKIIPGDDNVWHHITPCTSLQETPITVLGTSNNRIYRGTDKPYKIFTVTSGNAGATIGFRPVLEYKEDGSTIW